MIHRVKYQTVISVLTLVLSGCQSREYPEVEWNQAEPRSYSEIKHGIPVYDGKQVTYRQSGAQTLKVQLAAPSVVSVAKDSMGWGFFQFPKISRTLDGDLLAIWNMKHDAIAAYGKPGRDSAVSEDGGKSWVSTRGEISEELVLPSGDHLALYRPVALNVETLKLPEPLDTRPAYEGARSDPFTLYKVSELPHALQGAYFQRLRKGEKQWNVEQSVVNDPQMVRYSRGGLFPVMWAGDMKVMPDRSIIIGTYPGFALEADGSIKSSSTFFYRSTDEGRTWDILSRIPYVPDTTRDRNGARRIGLGFTEPAFEILPDGTFLCVERTTDGMGSSPMYATRSKDSGKTWTNPEVIASWGVLPRLLQLDNGVLVLSSGRPGVQVRFSVDGGYEWTDPFEMLSWEGEGRASCGYTDLLPSGPDSFLIIYSDFHFKNEQGHDRKAIKVRKITVKAEQKTS